MIWFVAGIIFSIVVIPLLEAMVEAILVMCEKHKSLVSVSISKNNAEIAKLIEPEEEEETVSRVIGFVTDSKTEEDEEEED